MTRYAIALGSNEGDRVGHLRGAVEGMGGLGSVVAVSGLYETEPIGGPDQGPFLNAVVILDTPLSPTDLLERLRGIEEDHGRERQVRWGPRTLDLDIVAVDSGPVDRTGLQIPHPRAAERRFVLQPLVEIWPAADIGGGVTASEAVGAVADQEVDLLAPKWVAASRVDQGGYWVGAQLIWFATIGIALVYDGSLPDGELDPIRVSGGALLVIGAAIALFAARSLGRALSILPEPVRDVSLVETGMYGHARHPIYGSVFLVMLGVSLLLASRAGTVLSIGLLLFFWAKSTYEERQLRIAYPGYSSYRRRVRRRMLPYLF
ncbi:MAG TPA: 2-amino-4-hydroxy-6-hydroxymethyldihydropteridine diphosphokinase [Acidimicrobiia bacterium]|nr:2-amino-4-hydroxy-6-hydroxymethyldihydropteridine diphosphokinase [Acidimicrobiia bacterium]